MRKMSLKAWRTEAGLSQKEVAAKLGRSNKTVSKWEKGLTFPEPKDIDAMCELYGCTYDEIKFLHTSSL